ncbi:MAG: TauD/TfdA family dioxygenase [Hyphomicrobiaceae bacterium]
MRTLPALFACQAGLHRFLGGRTRALQTRSPAPGANPSVTGRKSLYLSSHAGGIIGWPTPEALSFLMDLTEHATQREFTFAHKWQVGDLVVWDNRQTMHRARPFRTTSPAMSAARP